MSQENVQLVQKSLERFAISGEPPWDRFHEHVEVYNHDIMDAGDYRGHAGVARWLDELGTVVLNSVSVPRTARECTAEGKR
jgi:hypothetical protein